MMRYGSRFKKKIFSILAPAKVQMQKYQFSGGRANKEDISEKEKEIEVAANDTNKEESSANPDIKKNNNRKRNNNNKKKKKGKGKKRR